MERERGREGVCICAGGSSMETPLREEQKPEHTNLPWASTGMKTVKSLAVSRHVTYPSTADQLDTPRKNLKK